jgi:outer membrane protein assembly factor BamB
MGGANGATGRVDALFGILRPWVIVPVVATTLSLASCGRFTYVPLTHCALLPSRVTGFTTPVAPPYLAGLRGRTLAFAASGEMSGDVWALNAADGAVLWSQHMDGYGDMSAADGLFFLEATLPTRHLHFVRALRPSDGATLWQFDAPPDSGVSLAEVAGGAVYVYVSTSHEDVELDQTQLYALRETDGAVLWQAPPKSSDYEPSNVFRIGDIVYVTATRNGTKDALEALRAADGAVLWRGPVFISGDPLVVGDILYVTAQPTGREPNELYALRATSGEVLWHRVVPGAGTPLGAADGLLYFDGYS